MKRILSLLFVFLLVISTAIFMLTACGDDEETKNPSKGPSTSDISSRGDMFAERALVEDGLKAYDFGGRKFRIVTNRVDEIVGEGEHLRNTGRLLTDAALERNEVVEGRFNTDIELVFTGTIPQVEEYVSKTVLSGVDEFDLYIGHTGMTRTLFLKSLFINWYDVPNVDFSKPWWSTSTTETLTVDGKCVLAVSDLCFTTKYCTHVMFFNKNLANAYDLGNLYDVALNGEWTYDYFYSLVKDVYVDEDGDGQKSFGDFYGHAQGNGSYLENWMFAMDNPYVREDAEGVPKIVIKTDKVSRIFSTIYDLCWNTKGVFFYHWNANNAPSDAVKWVDMFLNKQTIFTISYLQQVVFDQFRNFEDEYGILPVPKYDENQKEYYTHSFAEHTLLAVPKTAKDLEFIGTITEALSAESYKRLIPTFYEIALKTRYLRDDESKKVLDLIVDGTVYDFAVIHDVGVYGLLETTVGNKGYNFESAYAMSLSKSGFAMKKVLKEYDKLG